MYRCLELAKKGIGYVAPNPMVGAVLVCDDKIIGEGFHRKYGEAHAEVNAINSVKDQSLLEKSTLYVNLEPCSHYGKTPPCSKLIIEKKVPQVVVAQVDPFSKVSGRGIEMLRENGVNVIVGMLEKEAELLNIRFITSIKKKRPYIILKWAQSSDGYIDNLREIGDGKFPVKFSNYYTQILVHKMRADESAIMVGEKTFLLDKPLLNVRYWSGENPFKIIVNRTKALSDYMNELWPKGIQSVIVEGGGKLLRSFIEEKMWDEARIEISNVKLGDGVEAPEISGNLKFVQKCKNSTILYYNN